MTDLNAGTPKATPAGPPGHDAAGPGRVPHNVWAVVIVGAIVAACLLAAWMAADAWIHPPGP
jgi:hypothetical protein